MEYQPRQTDYLLDYQRIPQQRTIFIPYLQAALPRSFSPCGNNGVETDRNLEIVGSLDEGLCPSCLRARKFEP